MFKTTKPTQPVEAESLKHENEALKKRLSTMFQIDIMDDGKALKELMLVQKIVMGLFDETLTSVLETSEKTSNELTFDVTKKDKKAVVATVTAFGSDSGKVGTDSYEFKVQKILISFEDGVSVQVPKQWMDNFSIYWIINGHINRWSDARKEKVESKLDSALEKMA